MLGVGVLYWYPNRNPSDEIKRTTGLVSLERGRATDSMLAAAVSEEEEEEKKRKAKAPEAARAMQAKRRREMKRTVVDFDGGVVDDDEEVESSVAKERRAVDGFCGSSSDDGICIVFVKVPIETESEPMFTKFTQR